MSNKKLWGGRFSCETDALTDDFNSSIHFDKRLYKEDIQGSIAHSKMLAKQGIISFPEAKLIKEGLENILKEIEEGKVCFDIGAEDIHMNIEKLLIEKIGEAGKKLHSARSRNDQVALDTRMYVKNEIFNINKLLFALQKAILSKAKENLQTVMPGFTHMQKAQPITFAHHICAYFEMFKRDISRLEDTYKRTNVSPLGACALAGTTYNLDREFVADELGFDSVSLNSIDAVSDRDFCAELIFSISMIMMHLSRFCEEIISWCSSEYNFVELDDAYCTGSSIMPQKKNPDIAELIRGKTGRVYGDLIGILTVMKGLALAYNKDMQEDKESLFDAVDTVKMCLTTFTKMFETLKVNKEAMLRSAKCGFLNATDVADYLVKKGLAFRDTHAIAGKLVYYCIQNTKSLEELGLKEYKSFSNLFEEDIFEAISLENCVLKRKTIGGPSAYAMEKVLQTYENYLKGQL